MRESICAAHYIKAFFVTTEINIFIEKEICSRSCEKILSVKKTRFNEEILFFVQVYAFLLESSKCDRNKNFGQTFSIL